MSFDDDEIEQDDQDGAAGDGGGGGEEAYDDTADEAGVDSAFVVAGDKQPLSKGTVAMFVILALAGAGTYGMYVKSGTQSATAAADPKAQAVIKEFMTQRDKNAQAMKKMLTDTDAVVRQFMNYRVEQIPLSGLVANPFRTAPANPGEPSRADEEAAKKKREEERVAILKAVNGLQLQSVMHSDSRKSCMINNALYTEGQQVDSFLIEKIAPNCVVVRNGQYRFELRMQR